MGSILGLLDEQTWTNDLSELQFIHLKTGNNNRLIFQTITILQDCENYEITHVKHLLWQLWETQEVLSELRAIMMQLFVESEELLCSPFDVHGAHSLMTTSCLLTCHLISENSPDCCILTQQPTLELFPYVALLG